MVRRRPTTPTALLIALGLALAACGGDSGAVGTTLPVAGTQAADTTTAAPPTEGTPATTGDPGTFTPEQPLPDGFPVFPGAVLAGEVPGSEGGHLYLFAVDGAAPDICEFFGRNLLELRFDGFGFSHVGTDCSDPHGFRVEAGWGAAPVVTVGFADDVGGGRAGYTVLIDYEAWPG